MKENITRGTFFKKSAYIAAGVTAAGVGVGILNTNKAEAGNINKSTPTWPWPYATLDPEEVRILAHDSYWGGFACCAGAFHSIITKLQELVGAPYTDFPTKMMLFGHGGGAGWGTICGALNGSAAAISLICEKSVADQLVHELNGWYTQTRFPSATSNTYATSHQFNHNDYDMELVQNTCGSPLCHVSVTDWCVTSGIGVKDKQRKERCARLTGDVAAKTVELLNAHFSETFTSTYVPPESIASCLACHGSSGTMKNVSGKMECTTCHGEPHGLVVEPGIPIRRFEIDQNYPNPFNKGTTIEFNLKVSSKVTLEVYNLSGQHIKTIISNKLYNTGNNSIVWDGNDEHGNNIKSGMYVYRLRVGNNTLSRSMMKLEN